MPKMIQEIVKYSSFISNKGNKNAKKSRNLDDEFEKENFTIKNNRNSVVIGESPNGRIAFDGEKLKYGEIRCLTVGSTGSGKSYTTRNMIERFCDYKTGIVIVVDPEGEYFTLRKKYDFVILGTDEDFCDILITEENTSELAIKMLKNKINVIIDLSATDTRIRQEITAKYINTMFENSKYSSPTQLVIEEASKFAAKGDPNPTNIKCTASLKQTAQQGRKRGISTFYNTQRITQLHKDISAECDSWIIGKCIDELDVKRNGIKIGLSDPSEIKALNYEFFAWGAGFDHSSNGKAVKFKSLHPISEHLRNSHREPSMFPLPETETVMKWIGLMGGLVKGPLKQIIAERKNSEKQLSLIPEIQEETKQTLRGLSDKIESIPKKPSFDDDLDDLPDSLSDSCEICGKTAVAHGRCNNCADYESFGMDPSKVKWGDEDDDEENEDDE